MEEMGTHLVPDNFCRANSFINCTVGEEKKCNLFISSVMQPSTVCESDKKTEGKKNPGHGIQDFSNK